MQGKFKLADPGFATFQKKNVVEQVVVAHLYGGTETFGKDVYASFKLYKNLILSGAPETHPRRRESLSAVPRTIDTWSLACVFSIAATWVVLGYEGIQQFRKLREKAIEDIVLSQQRKPKEDSSKEISKSDYFHDGCRVLAVVLEWHDMLRSSLRNTDTVTSKLLDLLDQKMLVPDATKRLSAEKTCEELDNILAESQVGPRKAIPESIMAVLKKVDTEHAVSLEETAVFTRAAPETRSNETLTINQKRKNKKSKLNSAPFRKTAQRSDYLSPEITAQQNQPPLPSTASKAPEGRTEIAAKSPTDHPNRPTLSQTTHSSQNALVELSSDSSITATLSRRTVPRQPRDRKSQDVFQAREEVEHREKGIFVKFSHRVGNSSGLKDPLLEKHYRNRDIVSSAS